MLRSLLAVATVVLCASAQIPYEYQPAIAMFCGKNVKHRDTETGEWLTDSTGTKDCMNAEPEILSYCQKVYPHMNIVQVMKETESVKVTNWCALRNAGPNCKGHPHSVFPYKCLTGEPENFKAKPRTVVERPKDVPEGLDALCYLPKVTGVCRARFEKWYYNSQTSSCERFVYGGCGANKNNFDTEEECRDACTVPAIETYPIDPLFAGVGPVMLNEPMPTRDKVDKTMPPLCYQPKKVGMCKAYFERWYFDASTFQCSQFVYGGCQGNENNFASKDECLNVCPSAGIDTATTTAATTTTSAPSSTAKSVTTEIYHGAPVDVGQEHEFYVAALDMELRDHQSKMSKVMSDWDAATSKLLENSLGNPQGVQAKKKEIEADFQRLKDNLVTEHSAKVDQLSKLHSARMNSIFDKARQTSYSSLTQLLNAAYVQPNDILPAFKEYINNEKSDYDHAVDHMLNEPDDRLNTFTVRVEQIKVRVVNTLDLLKKNSDVYLSIQVEIDSFMESLPSDFYSPEDLDDLDETEMPIIDEGGLPADEGQDTDDAEESDDGDDYYDDDDDDEDYDDDEDEFDIASTTTTATTTTTTTTDFFDIDHALEPEYLPDDVDDDDDDVDEDDDDVDGDNDLNFPDLKSAGVLGAYGDDDTSEVAWQWIGLGAAGIVFVLFVVSMIGYSVSKRRTTHRFTEIRVEDHLTPEERQLWQMQQNGYENPTYKFFEKQQMA